MCQRKKVFRLSNETILTNVPVVQTPGCDDSTPSPTAPSCRPDPESLERNLLGLKLVSGHAVTSPD